MPGKLETTPPQESRDFNDELLSHEFFVSEGHLFAKVTHKPAIYEQPAMLDTNAHTEVLGDNGENLEFKRAAISKTPVPPLPSGIHWREDVNQWVDERSASERPEI